MLNAPAGTHIKVMPSLGEVQVCLIAVHGGGIEGSDVDLFVVLGEGVMILVTLGVAFCLIVALDEGVKVLATLGVTFCLIVALGEGVKVRLALGKNF
jgi:hypothetical protein